MRVLLGPIGGVALFAGLPHGPQVKLSPRRRGWPAQQEHLAKMCGSLLLLCRVQNTAPLQNHTARRQGRKPHPHTAAHAAGHGGVLKLQCTLRAVRNEKCGSS